MIKKFTNYYKIRTIKGYKILRSQNRLNSIELVKEQLTKTKLSINFKNNYGFNYELSLRQFLLRYLINYKFNISIMLSASGRGKIIYPLPTEWIEVLEKNKFDISKRISKFFFYIFSVYFFLSALKTFISTLFQSEDINKINDYVSIFGLSEKNLPLDSVLSYDFFTWFVKFYNNKINNFCVDFDTDSKVKSNLNIFTLKNIFPKLSLISKINFFFWFVLNFLRTFLRCFFCEWEKFYLFNEMTKYKIIQLVDKKKIAKEYWFSISDFIYRPIWTHAVSSVSKIVLYNYASSFLGHKINGSYSPNEVGISTMTWPIMIQWEGAAYSDYIKKELNNENIEILKYPPIWFADKKFYIKKNKRKTVCIFDVPPQNYLRSCQLNSIFYRNYNVSVKFLDNIYKIATKYDWDIYLKTKRGIDLNYHNKLYKIFFDEFSQKKNVFIVNANTSPVRLINYTNSSISIPFTSTSLIAKYYKKPTCYYDPISILDTSDRAAQGIKLICGSLELEDWFLRNSSMIDDNFYNN